MNFKSIRLFGVLLISYFPIEVSLQLSTFRMIQWFEMLLLFVLRFSWSYNLTKHNTFIHSSSSCHRAWKVTYSSPISRWSHSSPSSSLTTTIIWGCRVLLNAATPPISVAKTRELSWAVLEAILRTIWPKKECSYYDPFLNRCWSPQSSVLLCVLYIINVIGVCDVLC